MYYPPVFGSFLALQSLTQFLFYFQNFESAKLLVGPRLKLARDENIRLQNLASSSKGVVATASTSNSTSSSSSSTGVKPRKKQVNPIIMISPSSTALITMHNVKKFLEESMYVFPLSPFFPFPFASFLDH